jgi:hypothetical protein
MPRPFVLLTKYLLILTGVTLLFSDVGLSETSRSNCLQKSTQAVKEEILNFDENKELIEGQLAFLCSEASLIRELGQPYSDAEQITLPNVGALTVMQAYCRKNNSYFGTFCMATDVHSAITVLNSPKMLNALPHAIKTLGNKLNSIPLNEKLDFVAELGGSFAIENYLSKEGVTLLAAFIGLDDNGVQLSRLMADLLVTARYSEFSKVFAATLPVGTVATKTSGEYAGEISTVFYATRIGSATIAPLQAQDYRKTYKLYSSVYLGCQMAIQKQNRSVTIAQAGLAGVAYEFLKLKGSLKNWDEVNQAAEKTKFLMESGASFGFDHCTK